MPHFLCLFMGLSFRDDSTEQKKLSFEMFFYLIENLSDTYNAVLLHVLCRANSIR